MYPVAPFVVAPTAVTAFDDDATDRATFDVDDEAAFEAAAPDVALAAFPLNPPFVEESVPAREGLEG